MLNAPETAARTVRSDARVRGLSALDSWRPAGAPALDDVGHRQVFDASARGLAVVETLSEHDDLLGTLDFAPERAASLPDRRPTAPLPKTRIFSPRRAAKQRSRQAAAARPPISALGRARP